MSLPSSMADFVPCDRLLQKAYYTWSNDDRTSPWNWHEMNTTIVMDTFDLINVHQNLGFKMGKNRCGACVTGKRCKLKLYSSYGWPINPWFWRETSALIHN